MRLSATSALVLLWARQEGYRSARARDYLSRLDLEEGRDLYERCAEICPYYDEVIKNRKFGVLHLVEQYMAQRSEETQVVMAGAGFDALGLELTQRHRHVTVFELDRENMATKSRLVASLPDVSEDAIAFITTDLLEASRAGASLCAHGWDPRRPTLLVLEGISYYLSTESIQRLVEAVNPDAVIFEFLKPDDEIAVERVHIPRDVFGLISDLCGVSEIGRYSHGQLKGLFGDLPVSAAYDMQRLEAMRTGANRFFPTADSGWIELCLLARQPVDDSTEEPALRCQTQPAG